MIRWLAAIFVWLMSAQFALATPAAIDLGSANNTTIGSALTITVANNSPSGATILVALLHTNTGTTCTAGVPTDTAGNTYVQQSSVFPNNNSANGELCVWRVFNALALSSGNSITWPGEGIAQGFITAVAVAISGVTTSPLDVESHAGSTGGFCASGFPFGNGLTPTVDGDMLVGFCGWVNVGATTADFTQDSSVAWASPPTVNAYTVASIGIGGGNYVQPTAGNIDYEPSASGSIAEYVIALKASGGGGATFNNRLMMQGYGN